MKMLLVGIIVVVVGAVMYGAGYTVGDSAAQHRFVAFQLRAEFAFYHLAETGDLPRLKEQLGTMLVGRTRTYESLFPDDRTSKLLVEAQRVSADIEKSRGPLTPLPLSTPSK